MSQNGGAACIQGVTDDRSRKELAPETDPIPMVMALTLKVSFVAGDIADIGRHNVLEFFIVMVVSLMANIMKFGDRSTLGSTMLATSLVADLQLIGAAACRGLRSQGATALNAHQSATVVSMAIGAAVANVISVLLLIETSHLRR